jgi:predicted helicase
VREDSSRRKLSKDNRSLIYNDFLALSGIPPEVFEYRWGNRSALRMDHRSSSSQHRQTQRHHNDPNRANDPQYTVRLIEQVIAVSLETVELVQSVGTDPFQVDQLR